jgi:hypothetical protein
MGANRPRRCGRKAAVLLQQANYCKLPRPGSPAARTGPGGGTARFGMVRAGYVRFRVHRRRQVAPAGPKAPKGDFTDHLVSAGE